MESKPATDYKILLGNRLLAETGASQRGLGSAAWEVVSALENDVLSDLMAGETPEVCAILLSKLPPTKAALLIGNLQPERADAIAASSTSTAVNGIVEVLPFGVAELPSLVVAAIDAALSADAVRPLHGRQTDQINFNAQLGQLHGRSETGQSTSDDDNAML